MAGARAIASVSTTFGVAAGTLVVMAAVLAGPTILDCSKSSAGLMACLKDRMTSTGLFAPDSQGITRTGPASASSIADAAPIPGWIDATAGEYEPSRVSVELSAGEGAVALADPAPALVVDDTVALTPPPVADAGSTGVSGAPQAAEVAALPSEAAVRGAFEPMASSNAAEPALSAASPHAPEAGAEPGPTLAEPAGDRLAGPAAEQPTAPAQVALAAPSIALSALDANDAPPSGTAEIEAPAVGALSAVPAAAASSSPAPISLAALDTALSAVDASAAPPVAVAGIEAPSAGTLSAVSASATPAPLDAMPLTAPGTTVTAVRSSAAADPVVAAIDPAPATASITVTADPARPAASLPGTLTTPSAPPAIRGRAAMPSPSFADIALLDSPAEIDVTNTRDPPLGLSSVVMLPHTGSLSAASADQSVRVTTEASLGPALSVSPSVMAGASPPQFSDTFVALERNRSAVPEATGSIGLRAPDPATVTLEAGTASLPETLDTLDPSAPEAASREPYPDVIVLAPPSSGSNSSFAILKVN